MTNQKILKKIPLRAERRALVKACAERLKERLEAATDNNAESEWVVYDYLKNVHPNISYQVRGYGKWVDVDNSDDETGLIGITHISQETQNFVNSITEALSKEYPTVSIIWSEAAGNLVHFDISFHPNLNPKERWWRHESKYN